MPIYRGGELIPKKLKNKKSPRLVPTTKSSTYLIMATQAKLTPIRYFWGVIDDLKKESYYNGNIFESANIAEQLQKNNDFYNRMISVGLSEGWIDEDYKDDEEVCWTCGDKATNKEWRESLDEFEWTCDKCHKEEYCDSDLDQKEVACFIQ